MARNPIQELKDAIELTESAIDTYDVHEKVCSAVDMLIDAAKSVLILLKEDEVVEDDDEDDEDEDEDEEDE